MSENQQEKTDPDTGRQVQYDSSTSSVVVEGRQVHGFDLTEGARSKSSLRFTDGHNLVHKCKGIGRGKRKWSLLSFFYPDLQEDLKKKEKKTAVTAQIPGIVIRYDTSRGSKHLVRKPTSSSSTCCL